MSTHTTDVLPFLRGSDEPLLQAAADEIDWLRSELRDLNLLVEQQAEDEGLWFVAQTAAEGYLQQELRRLHLAIEGIKP